MRVASAVFDAEVAGATFRDALEVNLWRGGQLLTAGLAVEQFRIGWDADRLVQGQASFTFTDPDGTLAPWSLGDPLGPGGSRLQVTWVSGLSGTRVPLGWWRIRRADPHESWRIIPGHTDIAMVSGGGSVDVAADEETATAVMNRLDAEVVSSATCIVEITRLLREVATVTTSSVTDRNVPAAMVYSDQRMDAVADLLDVLSAVSRMGPDGSFQIVPERGVGPVWTVAGGETGVLVALVRSLSDDGVYNAATSNGETSDGQPLTGRARLNGGPLYWGGPFGKVPIFHSAIATTAESVRLDAVSTLAGRDARGEVDLAVTCLTHPGVQPNDRVTLVAPTRAGDAPITGRVVGMTISSVSGIPSKSMALTVRVSTDALEAIAHRVRQVRA